MASFEVGHKKVGGRVKGTPNKNSLVPIKTRLEELNWDLIDELHTIYVETQDEQLRMGIVKELMKYVYPQRKAIEFDNTEINMPVINIIGI